MDGALETCPLPVRETRRADVAVCAATAEPGPGDRTPGAPGCASTWEVSDSVRFICHPRYTKVLFKCLVHGRPLDIGADSYGIWLSEDQRKGLRTCFSGLDSSPGVTVQSLAGVPLVVSGAGGGLL